MVDMLFLLLVQASVMARAEAAVVADATCTGSCGGDGGPPTVLMQLSSAVHGSRLGAAAQQAQQSRQSGDHTSSVDADGMRGDDSDSPLINGAPDEAIADCSSLGPLRHLVGEWKGLNGVTMNWLPPAGTHEGKNEAYALYAEYNETLTFEPLPRPAHNRGQWGVGQQLLYGLQVKQFVQGPHDNPLHFELGEILYDDAPPSNSSSTLIRTLSVPHGVSLTASGGSDIRGVPDILLEQARINNLTNLGVDSDWLENEAGRLAYALNNYTWAAGRYQFKSPQWASNVKTGSFGDILRQSLLDHLAAEGDIGGAAHSAWRLQVQASTVSSPPEFSQDRTGLANFQSTYWLYENLTTPVLQYFQNVGFSFGLRSDAPSSCLEDDSAPECKKVWPHFQLSTLVKVRDYEIEGC